MIVSDDNVSTFVCRVLHALLIGSKGSTRARLEKESKVHLSIPLKGKDGDIGEALNPYGDLISFSGLFLVFVK